MLFAAVAAFAIATFAMSPAAAPADQATSPTGLVQSFDVFRQRHAVDFALNIRRIDGGLPASLRRLVVEFPNRTKLDSWRFPTCPLARLQARGASACPRDSRVGGGTSFGSHPYVFPATIEAKVTVFNGERIRARRLLLLYIQPTKGPTFVLAGHWNGTRRAGLRLVLSVPGLHFEFPPPASLTGLFFHLGRRHRGASFLRAPCPGTWSATGNYNDGSDIETPDSSRCDDPPIAVPAARPARPAAGWRPRSTRLPPASTRDSGPAAW